MNTRRIINAPLLAKLEVVSLTSEYTDLIDEDGALGLASEFFAIVGTRHAGGGMYEFRFAPVELYEDSTALIRWGGLRTVWAEDLERRFTCERAA